MYRDGQKSAFLDRASCYTIYERGVTVSKPVDFITQYSRADVAFLHVSTDS